jgi:16S rRNA (cytidine1402-2'-O)-methyltransferase
LQIELCPVVQQPGCPDIYVAVSIPERGAIYVVATPIGNLDDITLRAIRVLREVDVVAAEDTRRTRILLTHLGITKPLVSLHEAVEEQRARELVRRASGGQSIALVSDAGTPLVSDPGYRLVTQAISAGIPVVPIPGPSAPIALLSCAGLPTDRFTFAGFLPARRAQRERFIAELASRRDTLVLFETARRLPASLADLAAALGPRPAAIGRELTKKFEEIVRGNLVELAERYADASRSASLRGEITLAIGGASGAEAERADVGGDERLDDVLRARLATGESVSLAARAVAAELGLPRRQVYQRALEIRKKFEPEAR